MPDWGASYIDAKASASHAAVFLMRDSSTLIFTEPMPARLVACSATCLAMSADRTWDAVLNRLLENYGEAVAKYPDRAWKGAERQDFSAAE